MVAGLPYLVSTAGADIGLALEKYKNYRSGKTEFEDRLEDPSKISSSTYAVWRIAEVIGDCM